MQCQICGNTDGPFEVIEIHEGYTTFANCPARVKRVVLACEDCSKKERKKRDTANLRNPRHDR